MRWAARGLLCALALSMTAAAPAPAGAVASRPTKAQSPSFIDALSAIPAASQALATAKSGMGPIRSQVRALRATAVAAHATLAQANDVLRETVLARTRADLAAANAQSTLDDAARILYSSGGTVPTLAEVLLTADSPGAFTHSMQTREYLSGAASSVLAARNAAEAAVASSTEANAAALTTRDAAAAEVTQADEAIASAQTQLDAAKTVVTGARKKYKKLMRITSADRSADYGDIKKCGDWLTKLLARTGFEGENLREAWAIVMRESGGREDAVSVTNDLGLFQINTATWQSQPWFDRKALLTREYNAKVGYLLSQGGKSWYSWGLDGHGRPDAGAYLKSGWTPEHIYNSIIVKYIAWYQAYPCRPAYETGYPYALPVPNSDETPDSQDQFAGGGYVPEQSGGTGDQPTQPEPVPSGAPEVSTALIVPPNEALAGAGHTAQ